MRPVHALLFLLAALGLLVLAPHAADAAASAKSELSCGAAETDPGSKVTCTIRVFDAYGSPTMAFDAPADFAVSVFLSSSSGSSVGNGVEASLPTRSRADAATAEFDVVAARGGVVTVRVRYAGTEIVGSGATIHVLSYPAVYLGPIACAGGTTGASGGGLELRRSITCQVPLYDAVGGAAAVRESDVVLAEAAGSISGGRFQFLSGVRMLNFVYTAPRAPELVDRAAGFVLTVTLPASRHAQRSQSVSFPLEFPLLPPVSGRCTLSCVSGQRQRPMVCTLSAADALGPVRFARGDFAVEVWREEDGAAGGWVDDTAAFTVSVAPVPDKADQGLISVQHTLNDVLRPQQLRVFHVASSGAVHASVSGSPFLFTSGIPPTPETAKLRECRSTIVTSRNATRCFIELYGGVSGDVRSFNIFSTLKGNVTDVQYVPRDPSCDCPIVRFSYRAPVVPSRTTDFISVSVGNELIAGTPYHMNVFPASNSGAVEDAGNDISPVLIITVGLLFYTLVIGGGFTLVVRRAMIISRVRHAKAAKTRAELHERVKQRQQQGGADSGSDTGGAAAQHPHQRSQTPAQPQPQPHDIGAVVADLAGGAANSVVVADAAEAVAAVGGTPLPLVSRDVSAEGGMFDTAGFPPALAPYTAAAAAPAARQHVSTDEEGGAVIVSNEAVEHRGHLDSEDD